MDREVLQSDVDHATPTLGSKVGLLASPGTTSSSPLLPKTSFFQYFSTLTFLAPLG